MLDSGSNLKFAAVLSAAAASGAVAGLLLSNLKSKPQPAPEKWIRVGTVKELTLYPVKSCKGIRVDEATTTMIGMKGSDYLRDRVFMVVDGRSVFQTQRTVPKMALIYTAINGNQLTLSTDSESPIVIDIPEYSPNLVRSCRIFDDKVKACLDCGDEIAAWLSKVLEKPELRLYYHYTGETQRSRTALQKKFPSFTDQDKGTFQDQTAVMMMAEESVNQLNTELKNPVSANNFRPNILIQGIPEPYAEDFWSYVRIGKDGPIFKNVKPCTRCKLTTVNPETGVFDADGEPLSTLVKQKRKMGNDIIDKLVHNQGIMGLQLGMFSGVGRSVKVGDPVYAAAY